MSDRVAVGERGQASVTYLLAIGVSMLVFMFMANVLMFLYARGVIRAAVDEGARAGAMASSADVECEARANDALDDLLAGEMGDGVTLSCAVVGGLSSFLCEVVVHVVGSRRPGKVMANALSACFHPWVPVPSSPLLLFPMLRIAK